MNAEGLEDEADCSWFSLTRSTKEDPCEEKMHLLLLFYLLRRLAGELGLGLFSRKKPMGQEEVAGRGRGEPSKVSC